MEQSKAYSRKTILKLILRGAIVGVFAGLTVVLYRLLIEKIEGLLFFVIETVKGNPASVALWLIGLACLGAGIAFLIKWEPNAAGSGIPQITAEIKGALSPSWWRVIFIKFLGGAGSIFGGLSLGREGPSVQLGGMAAKGAAQLTKADEKWTAKMIACGAGAGLAAAFNAPLAGVLFVLEEIYAKFDKAVLGMGLVAAIVADFISKIIFGQGTAFSFEAVTLPLRHYWLLAVLGVILGLFGAFYNVFMSKSQDIFKKISRKIPTPISFAVIFVLSGVIGLFIPGILGGGNKMVDILVNESPTLKMLIFLLIAKFLFSALSLSTGSPGGSLQPFLIMGAFAGAIFGMQGASMLGLNPQSWQLFVMLAMAGVFASIVRSPLTGIVLVFEMTGSMSIMLPLILVSLISYAVADLCKVEPFYEAALSRLTGKKQ